MPREPMDLDILLDGGGDDADWLALVRDPDAEVAWQDALRRRRAVDEVAALVLGRPWLAERLLTLHRLLRRTPAAIPMGPALVLQQPAYAAALFQAPAAAPLEVPWGARAVWRSILGEVIHVMGPDGGQVWYCTAAGDGVLAGPGWHVEEGDLPLLLVAVEGQAASLSEALAQAPAAAVCLVVPEGEIDPH